MSFNIEKENNNNNNIPSWRYYQKLLPFDGFLSFPFWTLEKGEKMGGPPGFRRTLPSRGPFFILDPKFIRGIYHL